MIIKYYCNIITIKYMNRMKKMNPKLYQHRTTMIQLDILETFLTVNYQLYLQSYITANREKN